MRSTYLTLIIAIILLHPPPWIHTAGSMLFLIFNTYSKLSNQAGQHAQLYLCQEVIMLICITDSEYFNIALKAYINEPHSKPLDIKELICYPFSGQSEMFYTFFATDAGARLSTILIDYSRASIEVLQVALSLKAFNPLLRIFLFTRPGYTLSELESSLAIVVGAEFITCFAGLSAALARWPLRSSPPANKLYIAIPDSYNLTRKETFLISLLMGGMPLYHVASTMQLTIKRVYYYRSRVLSKLAVKNNVELVTKVQGMVLRHYRQETGHEIVSLR